MKSTLDDRKTLGPWRSWMFRVWIGLTAAAAIYVAVAAPFADLLREEVWMAGVIVPPLMILLMGLGLGWLVLVVKSSPVPSRREPHLRNPPQD